MASPARKKDNLARASRLSTSAASLFQKAQNELLESNAILASEGSTIEQQIAALNERKAQVASLSKANEVVIDKLEDFIPKA